MSLSTRPRLLSLPPAWICRPVSRGVVDRWCHDVQRIYINRYRYECCAAHRYDGRRPAPRARRQRFRCVRCLQRICSDE